MGGGVRGGRREGINEEGMWRRGRRGWTEEDGRDREEGGSRKEKGNGGEKEDRKGKERK